MKALFFLTAWAFILISVARGDEGLIESDNRFVTPRSLHLAQLEDRLGAKAVRAVATEKQISGKRGQIWLDLIDPFSALPVYEDPEKAPWKGWENWKAFGAK